MGLGEEEAAAATRDEPPVTRAATAPRASAFVGCCLSARSSLGLRPRVYPRGLVPAAAAAATAPARPLVGRRAHHVGEEGELARRLDGGGHIALMLPAGAGDSSRLDLAPVAHEPAQEVGVLVVDPGDALLAEHADLGPPGPAGGLGPRRPGRAAVVLPAAHVSAPSASGEEDGTGPRAAPRRRRRQAASGR